MIIPLFAKMASHCYTEPAWLLRHCGMDGATAVELVSSRALDQSSVVWLSVTAATGVKVPLVLKIMKLPAKATWPITRASFLNEQAFYNHCSSQADALGFPGFVAAGCVQDDSPGLQPHEQQSFYLFLHTLPAAGTYQQHNFDTLHTHRALAYAARWHASFWGRTDAGSTSTGFELFGHGCWWRSYLRPSVKYSQIVASFQRLLVEFSELAGAFPDQSATTTAAPAGTEKADGSAGAACGTAAVMVRGEASFCISRERAVAAMTALQEAAPFLHASLQREAKERPLTVLHGDFKTSNIFFKKSDSVKGGAGSEGLASSGSAAADSAAPSFSELADGVLSLDFQWSGFGTSGVADVVYLLWGECAVSSERVTVWD